MDKEKVQVRVLAGIAMILLAACIAASELFVPPIGSPVAEVLTDTSSTSLASAYNGKIHLNTAASAQLETLPGVGGAMARRILAYRREHGRFHSVDELQKVKGIGPKVFTKLKDKVDL